MESIALSAEISGRHIVLMNDGPNGTFPHGVVAKGDLTRHPSSGLWIIATSETDMNAREVGGCSDGPQVVDLKSKIYWTC